MAPHRRPRLLRLGLPGPGAGRGGRVANAVPVLQCEPPVLRNPALRPGHGRAARECGRPGTQAQAPRRLERARHRRFPGTGADHREERPAVPSASEASAAPRTLSPSSRCPDGRQSCPEAHVSPVRRSSRICPRRRRMTWTSTMLAYRSAGIALVLVSVGGGIVPDEADLRFGQPSLLGICRPSGSEHGTVQDADLDYQSPGAVGVADFMLTRVASDPARTRPSGYARKRRKSQ